MKYNATSDTFVAAIANAMTRFNLPRSTLDARYVSAVNTSSASNTTAYVVSEITLLAIAKQSDKAADTRKSKSHRRNASRVRQPRPACSTGANTSGATTETAAPLRFRAQ